MPDGGEVALDWVDDNKDTYRGLAVILPGLTGDFIEIMTHQQIYTYTTLYQLSSGNNNQ